MTERLFSATIEALSVLCHAARSSKAAELRTYLTGVVVEESCHAVESRRSNFGLVDGAPLLSKISRQHHDNMSDYEDTAVWNSLWIPISPHNVALSIPSSSAISGAFTKLA